MKQKTMSGFSFIDILYLIIQGPRLIKVIGHSWIEYFFLFTILFISTWNFCLPVSNTIEFPWWATKIQILPSLYLNEIFFITYLIFFGFPRIYTLINRLKYPNSFTSICLIALALWCATTSILGPLPFHDAGRSARLIIGAFLLVTITQLASHNPLFILRTMLFGFIAGTLVNLSFSFKYSKIIVGTLPILLGQNTPGPAMGIAVCLSAWFLLLSKNKMDIIISFLCIIICGLGAFMSFSKIGILGCFTGFFCVFLVTLKTMYRSKSHLMFYPAILVVIGFSYYLINNEDGQEAFSSIKQMLVKKIKSADIETSQSLQERLSYFLGVEEIILSNPIGVGYSGFKDAIMQTHEYNRNPFAPDESERDPADSNPHAFILYYTSAGGIVGGILSLTVFLLLWRMLHRGLKGYGIVGILIANLTGVAYLVMAISVPYLLSSVIMTIPAAVAGGVSIWKYSDTDTGIYDERISKIHSSISN